jgi:hypothetical protein
MEDGSAYEEDHFVVGGDVGFAVLIPHHAALREAPLLHLTLDDVRVLVGHLRRQRQGVGLFPHTTPKGPTSETIRVSPTTKKNESEEESENERDRKRKAKAKERKEEAD